MLCRQLHGDRGGPEDVDEEAGEEEEEKIRKQKVGCEEADIKSKELKRMNRIRRL